MTSPSISLDPDWTDIRDGVRAVCATFGNDYWVKLEHESGYPTAFVKALTDAGYAVLAIDSLSSPDFLAFVGSHQG